MRALISVYDKSGVDDFARGLHELGWAIIASGGTAAFLAEHEVPVTQVESLTGFTEMLGHRVVTLHPAVHGGILARRNIPEDVADLEKHGIEPIDLVVVNLYPFTEVASRRGVTEEEAVEMIDIGGPALLRAAAKNFMDVGVVAGQTGTSRCSRSCAGTRASRWTRAAPSPARRSSSPPRTSRRSRHGSPTVRRFRRG